MEFAHSNILKLYIILLVLHPLFMTVIIEHSCCMLSGEINCYIFKHSIHFYIQISDRSSYANFNSHNHFPVQVYSEISFPLVYELLHNQGV